MCSRRCETPMRSRVSCSDAARTHDPNDTERTPGMCSESTVNPFGSTVRRRGASAAMTAGALVAIDQLDLHAITFLDHVLGLFRALVPHLGDVDQPFGAGHDLNERAEGRGRL